LGNEAAGEVEFDELVGGDGGSGEGSDEDLDYHRNEEEHADGELREENSRALVEDILSIVYVAC